MKRILVVIDMQNDFITGALPADGGVEIIPRIVDKIKNGNYDRIVCTYDTHYSESYEETIEGKNIPPHCFYKTAGWDLNSDISSTIAEYTDDIQFIPKESFGSYIELPMGIIPLYPKFDDFEIELCGVCTDICVVSNALILRAVFSNTRIIVDSSCCAGSTREAHEAALTVMKNCLIEVI